MNNSPSAELVKAVAEEYLALTAPHKTFGSLTFAAFIRRIEYGATQYFQVSEVETIHPARKDGGTAYKYSGLTLAAFLVKHKEK